MVHLAYLAFLCGAAAVEVNLESKAECELSLRRVVRLKLKDLVASKQVLQNLSRFVPLFVSLLQSRRRSETIPSHPITSRCGLPLRPPGLPAGASTAAPLARAPRPSDLARPRRGPRGDLAQGRGPCGGKDAVAAW